MKAELFLNLSKYNFNIFVTDTTAAKLNIKLDIKMVSSKKKQKKLKTI